MAGSCWPLASWFLSSWRWVSWSGFCYGCGAMVLLSSRFIALSWARCYWHSALNLRGPESEEGIVTLYKSLSLCMAGVVLSGAALAADLVQTATLKDLQTVGTTSKKQKHQ